MSMVYHSYDSSNAAVNELVAGAYAEHVGTLGFDEQLSSLSRNAVENKVITARILEDEGKYLLKTDASTSYVAKSNFVTELNAAIQVYYPVGTIYMNDVANTVPFDFGTWQLIDEKFLYGCASDFSDIGTPGGNATVTLAAANLPSEAISATTSSFTVTTDSTSTAHTHTTIETSSGTTGNVSGSGSTWNHRHNLLVYTGRGRTISNVYGYSLPGSNQGGAAERGYASKMTYVNGDSYYIDETNLQHTHSFTVPALATGGMSTNETHSHTLTVPSQTIDLTLGSGTAFSIMPPYHKCAIWHRTA